MAWAVSSFLNAVANKTAGTTITINTGTVAVNSVVIVLISKDNIGTTEAQTSEITQVTDTSSNTYTKAGEYNKGGAAGSSAVCSIWYSKITTALSAGTATATFSASITAKCITGATFTIGADSTLSVQSPQFLAGIADPGSMTISGLPSKEYLFIRGIALEVDSAGITVTTNYTEIPGIFTTGGGAASNMGVTGELRIFTGTGDTSDPATADADNANVFFALEEIVASDPIPPLLPRFNGMNTLIRM